MGKPPGNSVRFLFRLAKALRELRPDVVHTRNWGGSDGIVAARLAGIRRVVHGEHGWDASDPRGERRRRARRWLSRLVREYTCVSRDIERWLRESVGIRRPITQIYNGVDTRRFAPDPRDGSVRAELGIPPDAFVVGMVGRLDPIKDLGTLLAAFAALRARHPASRLLIAGDGPERARLEPGAGEGVRFLGERRDTERVLRALDVFALPSTNEGVSNTILEAMASAVPVVATRTGGNPELVQDGATGGLFPVGGADALASCLERYRASPALRREHGNAGRRRAIERFGIDRMVREYEAVWARA
jgi:sugar transferase (PEP-CTERM/EpsH1 system associated)